MKQLESAIESKFVKEAKKLGCLVKKLDSEGNVGWPDRLVLVPGGAILLIEFKRPGGALSPVQEAWHDDAKKIGHKPYVCYSWQAALNLIKEGLK